MLMPLTSDGAILEMNEEFGEQLQDFPGRPRDEWIGLKPRARGVSFGEEYLPTLPTNPLKA